MSDENADLIQQQRSLLYEHRQRLQYSLEIQAKKGADTSPSVRRDIDEARADIKRIKNVLHELGDLVEDHPNDADVLVMRVVGDAPAIGRPRPATPSQNKVLSAGIIARIGVLRALMNQDPEVRDAVVVCHSAFRSVGRHLRELRAYKALHDQLHRLQLQCFNPLQSAQRLLAISGDDDLTSYVNVMEILVENLHQIVQDCPFLPGETISWIPSLVTAHEAMRVALELHNVNQWDEPIKLIEKVLRIHPPQLHQRLSIAAQSMSLDDLVDGLSAIRETISRSYSEEEIVHQFADDIALIRQLDALVRDHGRWQTVESLLMLIERSLGYGDLASWWEMLKEQAAPLMATGDKGWALSLRQRTEKLENAIRDDDAFSIAQHIQSYHSQAILQFYRVDDQLQVLCRKLDHGESPFALMQGVLA